MDRNTVNQILSDMFEEHKKACQQCRVDAFRHCDEIHEELVRKFDELTSN